MYASIKFRMQDDRVWLLVDNYICINDANTHIILKLLGLPHLRNRNKVWNAVINDLKTFVIY